MDESIFKFSSLNRLPEIIHGISTRNYGDMRFGHLEDNIIIRNRERFSQDLGVNLDQVVVAGLSHGTKIALVGTNDRGKGALESAGALSQTDGLLTQEKNVYLMVTVADCLPVFVYDPVNGIVGLVHAGWRGIIAQIIDRLMAKLIDLGALPDNLIFTIGPGICQKHFVVKNEVLKNFRHMYPSATFVRNHDGYVDLKKAVLIDLIKAGVTKNNIEIAEDCPSCLSGRYGSFRKEGSGVPASAAIIGMKE